MCGPVAGLRRVTFSEHLDGPQAVATAAAILQRFTITVAAVISNHRIDRLESVKGADGTVLG